MSLSELIAEHLISDCCVEDKISNELYSIVSRLPECDWEDQYITGDGENKSLNIDNWVNDLMSNVYNDMREEAWRNENYIYGQISLIAEDFVQNQVSQLRP